MLSRRTGQGRVSRWAEPFVDQETGEVLPTNTRRATPMISMVLDEQARAGATLISQRKAMIQYLVRALCAFVVSTLPVPSWLGLTCFWLAVAFLLGASFAFYEYRCARIQSTLWPDLSGKD